MWQSLERQMRMVCMESGVVGEVLTLQATCCEAPESKIDACQYRDLMSVL